MKKFLAVIMCLVMLFSLASCKGGDTESNKPADFGTYGSDFARKLAKDYPYRKAYSEDEKSAGKMIKKEFEKLGYKVKEQTFTNGSNTSANYIIHIEGNGFIEVGKDGKKTKDIRKKAVIGAHYDSKYSSYELPEDSTFDGISDNASGIGCLVTIAKEIKNYKDIGFDIDIVAFGAGEDNFAGSRYYFESLSADEAEEIEVMYCIDSIYAGDKVYANAGMNSLNLDQKYKMRRKLFQTYDVAYDDMLASLNGFALLYNESNIVTDLNGDEIPDAYREVSLHKSDYSVFDEHNIPIVFFDSGNYFFDSLDKMKETKNLNLQEFNGIISGTPLDSTVVLDEVQVTEDKDLLEIRINNVSYCIMGSIMKGSDYGMTQKEYEESLTKITEETVETTKSTSSQK